MNAIGYLLTSDYKNKKTTAGISLAGGEPNPYEPVNIARQAGLNSQSMPREVNKYFADAPYPHRLDAITVHGSPT
jgi:hypothetical protein